VSHVAAPPNTKGTAMPMSNLSIGDRVKFTGGPRYNQSGTIVNIQIERVTWYVIRLDDGHEVRHRGRYGLSVIKS
jgi:cell envelope opacity-associated protein A